MKTRDSGMVSTSPSTRTSASIYRASIAQCDSHCCSSIIIALFLFFSPHVSSELHHHQSREIQQHLYQQRHQRRFFSTQTIWDARIQAHHSLQELQRVGGIFYEAAASSVRESRQRLRMQQQQRRGYHRHPINSNNNHNNYNPIAEQDPHAYLDEFGIPKEDPLLQDYNNNNNNISTGTRQSASSRQHHHQGDNDFIFLPHFNFRPENEGWASVSNLDVFFQSLYSYYYHRGLVPIIGKGVVELVTLFFTLTLSVFLFAYVDWHGLAQCHDEASCHADFIASYIIPHPFQQHYSLWNALVILYAVLFGSYGVLSCLQLAHTVQQAQHSKWVYEERLGISARKLIGGAVDWDRDVVAKLVALQQSGEYRVAINTDRHGQAPLDALVIANRILRKENFLVALFNKGLLDLNVPLASALVSDSFFCSSLEVS